MNISNIKAKAASIIKSAVFPALAKAGAFLAFAQESLSSLRKDTMSFLSELEDSPGGIRPVPDFNLPGDAYELSRWVAEERDRVFSNIAVRIGFGSVADFRPKHFPDLYEAARDAVWKSVLAKYGDRATHALSAKMAEEMGVVIQAEYAHTPGYAEKGYRVIGQEEGEFDLSENGIGVFGNHYGDNLPLHPTLLPRRQGRLLRHARGRVQGRLRGPGDTPRPVRL